MVNGLKGPVMEDKLGFIDLHVHTTASDGSLTPTQVVQKARELGLAAIAITDHDSVEGLEEAIAEGKKVGLEVVPGVELSVDCSRGTCHLLGYFIDHREGRLRAKLNFVQRARDERNQRMIQRLKELGIDLELEEVKAFAVNGLICRPHFALAMVKKGYVRSVDEAFELYLKKGGPAYVEKFRLTPKEALEVIKTAKGIPVLAHPFTLDLDEKELEEFVRHLKVMGLEGIEVFYPDHNEEQVHLYLRLAHQNNLVVTGGTDFHGPPREDILLGKGRGNLTLPYSLLEALKRRRPSS